MNTPRLFQSLLRNDLSSFIQKTFPIVSPGTVYHHNWHIDAIAYQLQRCLNGEINRLIITLPPRNLKSIAVSVAFPAYVLGRDPSAQIIGLSYSQELSQKHARDARAVMQSNFYRSIFPRTRIDPKKNAEAEFMTTRKGVRLTRASHTDLIATSLDELIYVTKDGKSIYAVKYDDKGKEVWAMLTKPEFPVHKKFISSNANDVFNVKYIEQNREKFHSVEIDEKQDPLNSRQSASIGEDLKFWSEYVSQPNGNGFVLHSVWTMKGLRILLIVIRQVPILAKAIYYLNRMKMVVLK